MKQIAIAALMVHLAAASIYAQQNSIRMTFSGTAGPSTINLQQPGTNTGEESFTENGTLGSFSFRNVSAETTPPQPSNGCSGPNQLSFLRVAGAGIFRFQDGSLLKVNLVQGTDCVDLTAQQGNCMMIFQITGGTGRFKNASGMLTLTETVLPVLANAPVIPSGLPLRASLQAQFPA